MSDKSGRITVVIADPDEAVATLAEGGLIAGNLMTVQRKVSDRRLLLSAIASLAPDVVVLDAALDGEIGGTIRDVLIRQPLCTVVVTGTTATAPQLSRAVIAGARGFVLKPYRPNELALAVRDCYASTRNLQQSLQGDAKTAGPQGALVAVYSPKGGVGTTTVAAHLAIALATKLKSDVALVDLDLQFGDVGVVLDLKGPNTIADLLAQDTLDRTAIDDVFLRHRSGVQALLAPEQIDDAQNVDPEKVRRLLGQLRTHFSYTVVDTWSALDDVTVTALSTADRVVLVTTPELPSLRNLRRFMNQEDQLDLATRGVVVVNRYSTRFGLQLAEIESALGVPARLTLPSEGIAITQAVNQGTVLTGRVAEWFGELAEIIVKELGPRQLPSADATAAAS